MKRGVAPVLFLVFVGLGCAGAQHALAPAPSTSIAALRPQLARPVPQHVNGPGPIAHPAPIVHQVPLAHPIIVVPRTGPLLHPIGAPVPPARQRLAPPAAEPGVNAPAAPLPMSAPAPTPTPNPLHFRRMALLHIIAFA